jgi:hypothetical protein
MSRNQIIPAKVGVERRDIAGEGWLPRFANEGLCLQPKFFDLL